MKAVPDKNNTGVFEGKALYFCGGGVGWPVGGCQKKM